MLKIGCHLSSSKGFLNMGLEAKSIGANTFAFFTRNPRGGKAKSIDEEDAKALVHFLKEEQFGTLVAHAPYTLNPASDTEKTLEFAWMAFEEDLQRMEYLPGQYYNFHPGSHVKQGTDVGIEKIINMLNSLMFKDMTTTVLLETMAGKGTEIGKNFEELYNILNGVILNDKMGICLDTCHIHDGGYDVKNDLEGVLEEFDKIIGLKYLKALHLNDSKNVIGARKDRHEVLGKGHIGEELFKEIVNHNELKRLPMILETPQDLEGYRQEISWLRKLGK